MTQITKVSWLVEDVDYWSGSVVFSQSYEDQSMAVDAYNIRKRNNLYNTVSIRKVEKYLLQE